MQTLRLDLRLERQNLKFPDHGGEKQTNVHVTEFAVGAKALTIMRKAFAFMTWQKGNKDRMSMCILPYPLNVSSLPARPNNV
jgi:hypothetical protein